MRRNEPLDAICAELKARSVPYQITFGRHYKVRFEVTGRPHMITVPTTRTHCKAVPSMRCLESVLRLHEGLQSFLTIRRIEAR
jgi:hypothetical protein